MGLESLKYYGGLINTHSNTHNCLFLFPKKVLISNNKKKPFNIAIAFSLLNCKTMNINTKKYHKITFQKTEGIYCFIGVLQRAFYM